MHIGPTEIVATFAEAFTLRYARLIVTAHDLHWLDAAAASSCGYGTSVIGCDAETGLERRLDPGVTPDGRPGAALLAFAFSAEALGQAVASRTAQCLLTCPTTAVFDGLPDVAERLPLGSHVRFFGDGFEKANVVGGHRYWRVPVMDGELLVEDTAGVATGVGGGNFILQGESAAPTLEAAKRAVAAIAAVPGTITPFPGGVVRAGSKVGSRYQSLRASTNEAFCPALVGRVETQLVPGTSCALEVVIDGVDAPAVSAAMAAGIRAAAGPGILAISAANYGGKLGKHRFHLHEVLTAS